MKAEKFCRTVFKYVTFKACVLAVGIPVLALCLLCSPIATSADNISKWKYYQITPPLHHDAKTMREFASDVKKLTKNELQITVYSRGELPYKPTEAVNIITKKIR